jgi:hypothetical protein
VTTPLRLSLGCAALSLALAGMPRRAEGAPVAGPSAPAATPLAAPADPPPKKRTIEWDPRWRRFQTFDYVTTGAFAAGAIATLMIPPSTTNWNGINSFDAGARDALRLRSIEARDHARDASDILIASSLNHLVIDALAVAWWSHDRRSIAFELMAMNAQALALNAFVQQLTAGLVGRERPYRGRCVGDADTQSQDCRDNKRYRSFFSGHSSTTFTAAGLTCQHHLNLPLYGGGAPDVLACVASIAVAGTTAYLRVAGDQHFLSDVLTGAGVGSLIGFGLPWVLHYMPREASPKLVRTFASGGFVAAMPTPVGGVVLGAF